MAHIPYGYRIEKGKAVLDEIRSVQIKIFYEEYLSGTGLVLSGQKAGMTQWQATLGRIIDNKVYMGDDFYPAIISVEMWHKAQLERKRRVKAFGRDKNAFRRNDANASPFWGIVYCSECGSEYKRYLENGKEHWHCSKYLSRDKKRCISPKIKEHIFEDAFMRMMGEISTSELASPPPKSKVTVEKKYDDPFKQAEYAYSQTAVDDFDFQTEKLLALLQDIPTEFDGEFMQKILKRIEVVHDGTAAFVFINHKRFREELV